MCKSPMLLFIIIFLSILYTPVISINESINNSYSLDDTTVPNYVFYKKMYYGDVATGYFIEIDTPTGYTRYLYILYQMANIVDVYDSDFEEIYSLSSSIVKPIIITENGYVIAFKWVQYPSPSKLYIKIYDPLENSVYTVLLGSFPGTYYCSQYIYDRETGYVHLILSISPFTIYRNLYHVVIDPAGHSVISFKKIYSIYNIMPIPLLLDIDNDTLYIVYHLENDNRTLYLLSYNLSSDTVNYVLNTTLSSSIWTIVGNKYILSYNPVDNTWRVIDPINNFTYFTLPIPPGETALSSFKTWVYDSISNRIVGVVKTPDNDYYIATVDPLTHNTIYYILNITVNEGSLATTVYNDDTVALVGSGNKVYIVSLNGEVLNSFELFDQRHVGTIFVSRLKHLDEEWATIVDKDNDYIYIYIRSDSIPTVITADYPVEARADDYLEIHVSLTDITGEPLANQTLYLYRITDSGRELESVNTTDEEGKTVLTGYIEYGANHFIIEYNGSGNYLPSSLEITITGKVHAVAVIYGANITYPQTSTYYEVLITDVNGNPLPDVYFDMVASTGDSEIVVGAGKTDYMGHSLVEVIFPRAGNYSLYVDIPSTDIVLDNTTVLDITVLPANITEPIVVTPSTIYNKLLDLEKKLDRIEVIVNATYTAVSDLEELITSILESLDNIEENLTIEIRDAKGEVVAVLESRADSIEVKLDSITSSLDTLSEMVSTVLDRIDSMNTTLHIRINASYNDIVSRLSTLLSRVDEEKAIVLEIKNETSELNEYVIEVIGNVSELKSILYNELGKNISIGFTLLNNSIVALNTSHGIIVAKLDTVLSMLGDENTTHTSIISGLEAIKEAIEEACNTTIEWSPETAPSGQPKTSIAGFPVEALAYILALVITAIAGLIYYRFRHH